MLPTPRTSIAPKIQYPTQAYCIIRGSHSQAEQTFHAGCYFCTHF
nr:MAG TPA: hypothetical protein [Caudoviricetes sp.]